MMHLSFLFLFLFPCIVGTESLIFIKYPVYELVPEYESYFFDCHIRCLTL